MNNEELIQYLETRRRELSEKEFFALIVNMLENQPSWEARQTLDSYLLTYSFVDEDWAARYWEQLLYDADPVQREFAVVKLYIRARKTNTLAYKILTEFLGEEPA